MRIVLDTNCVVSAFFWRGSAYTILELARAGRIKIYTSDALAAELLSALAKPKFAVPLRRAKRSAVKLVFGSLQVAHMIRKPQPIHPICRDSSDDDVLACALAAQADLIVSGDKDLLVLGGYGNSAIVTPSVALALIKSTIGP